jgi:hypothetical protein
MTMPSVVKLMAQRIPVVRTNQIIHEDSNGHRMEAWGLWDADSQTILMRKGQAPDRERTTFLHENLHALVSFGGLDVCQNEEDMVTRLAPLMLCWMRENPRALAYLTEKS